MGFRECCILHILIVTSCSFQFSLSFRSLELMRDQRCVSFFFSLPVLWVPWLRCKPNTLSWLKSTQKALVDRTRDPDSFIAMGQLVILIITLYYVTYIVDYGIFTSLFDRSFSCNRTISHNVCLCIYVHVMFLPFR